MIDFLTLRLGKCSKVFLRGAKYPNPIKKPKTNPNKMIYNAKLLAKERASVERLIPITAMREITL